MVDFKLFSLKINPYFEIYKLKIDIKIKYIIYY